MLTSACPLSRGRWMARCWHPRGELGEPRLSIAEAVGKITRRYRSLNEDFQNGVERLRNKQQSDRLKLALDLRDLKARIEDGEAGDLCALDWWGWFDANFRAFSRSEAEKMLAVANAENPATAMDKLREQRKARVMADWARGRAALHEPVTNRRPMPSRRCPNCRAYPAQPKKSTSLDETKTLPTPWRSGDGRRGTLERFSTEITRSLNAGIAAKIE